MLTGITLENFKAFKEPQPIPIRPITLVFGPNNAGKSSIIHALAFLKHVHDTNGDCNPGRMTYGWSNLDLGSWKNLVFGQNESASMMIRLETKSTAIQWRFEKARVVSFLIEEKFDNKWIATAKGENVGTKGIIWKVELHSSHSIWGQYKAALWRKLSERRIEPTLASVETANATTPTETVSNSIAVHEETVRSDHDYTPSQKDIFEKLFNLWLGENWKSPPLECDSRYIETTIAFESLFPRQNLPRRNIDRRRKSEQLVSYHDNSEYYELDGKLEWKLVETSNVTNKFFDLLQKSLDEGALTQKSIEIFQTLYCEGSLIDFDDALHVEELLSSFISHLHLDAQRFPPNGTLSKNRLSSSKSGDQPWISLLDVDYKHHFYADFRDYINSIKSVFNIPEEIATEILRSSENHELLAKWPEILRKLVDAGVEKQGIKDIYVRIHEQKTKAKLGDIPPILAANHALLQLGIQYSLEMRKRVEKIYPPKIDPLRDEVVSAHEVSENWDTELVFKGKSGVYTLHNLGSGVRVIVPVVVALSSAEVDLLSIEEPECHVHPKLQTELGDLLIQRLGWTYYEKPAYDPEDPFGSVLMDRSHKEHRRIAYTFVETHSEHLILRILRRIRETSEGETGDWPEALKQACPNGIRPEDVAVLYVEPGDEGAQVKKLRLNELGEFIDEWPNGFFEERIKEVF